MGFYVNSCDLMVICWKGTTNWDPPIPGSGTALATFECRSGSHFRATRRSYRSCVAKHRHLSRLVPCKLWYLSPCGDTDHGGRCNPSLWDCATFAAFEAYSWNNVRHCGRLYRRPKCHGQANWHWAVAVQAIPEWFLDYWHQLMETEMFLDCMPWSHRWHQIDKLWGFCEFGVLPWPGDTCCGVRWDS